MVYYGYIVQICESIQSDVPGIYYEKSHALLGNIVLLYSKVSYISNSSFLRKCMR